MNAAPRRAIRDGLRAAMPAAVFSGLPSTVHALITHRDPLEASVAAGSLIMPREQRRHRLLIAAVPAHIGVSVIWAVALAAVLPLKRTAAEGMLAGLAIAALDLGVVGRFYPRIRALPPVAQIADHVAFGVITVAALSRQQGTVR